MDPSSSSSRKASLPPSLGLKRAAPDFVGGGTAAPAEPASPSTPGGPLAAKRPTFFDLRTGRPYELTEEEQFGACRFVSEFEKLNRVGEGTYGIVYRARDTRSGEVKAII